MLCGGWDRWLACSSVGEADSFDHRSSLEPGSLLAQSSEQVWPFASLPRTEAGGGDVDDFWALALPLPSLSVGVPGCGALPAEDYA